MNSLKPITLHKYNKRRLVSNAVSSPIPLDLLSTTATFFVLAVLSFTIANKNV